MTTDFQSTNSQDLDWSQPVRTTYDNGDVVYLVSHRYPKIHNHTGPAIIAANGQLEWWLYGRKHQFENWVTLSQISESRLTYLRMRYGV